MDDITKAALREVVDYLYADEQKDWEASERPDSHIFLDLKRLDDWLAEVR